MNRLHWSQTSCLVSDVPGGFAAKWCNKRYLFRKKIHINMKEKPFFLFWKCRAQPYESWTSGRVRQEQGVVSLTLFNQAVKTTPTSCLAVTHTHTHCNHQQLLWVCAEERWMVGVWQSVRALYSESLHSRGHAICWCGVRVDVPT